MQKHAHSSNENRRKPRIIAGIFTLILITISYIIAFHWLHENGNNDPYKNDYSSDMTYSDFPEEVCEGIELESFSQLVGKRDPDKDYFVNNSSSAEDEKSFDCDFWYSEVEPADAWLKVSGDLKSSADWDSEIVAWVQEFTTDDKGSVIPPGIYGTTPIIDYPAPEHQILDTEEWDIAALVAFPEIASDLNGHDPEGTGTALALRLADKELHLSFVFERKDINNTGTFEPEVFANELIAIADQVRERVRQAG